MDSTPRPTEDLPPRLWSARNGVWCIGYEPFCTSANIVLEYYIPGSNFRLNKVQFISFVSFNAYFLQILRNSVFARGGLNFHLSQYQTKNL